MHDEHVKLVDINGVKLEIPSANIRSLQAHMEAVPVKDGASFFIGDVYEYIKLETTIGVFKIPRNPENDSEILTFMLRKVK